MTGICNWVSDKKRDNLAIELGLSPRYISKRYSIIITRIRNSITGLINTNIDLQNKVIGLHERINELARVKQKYVDLYLEKYGDSPDFSIYKDSIEKVKMSTRLYKLLKNRDIRRLSDLCNYTRFELLKGHGFGRCSLLELERIMKRYNVSYKED